MRVVTILAVLNAAIWCSFLVFFPGSHFAWPGSYKFWWFDDVPWAALLITLIAPVCLIILPAKMGSTLKVGLVGLLIITLATVVPYAAFSGGGV